MLSLKKGFYHLKKKNVFPTNIYLKIWHFKNSKNVNLDKMLRRGVFLVNLVYKLNAPTHS